MKTLRLVIELTYDDELEYGNDEVAKEWFFNEVLLTPEDGAGLVLHSNEMGDEVGEVRVLRIEEEVKGERKAMLD